MASAVSGSGAEREPGQSGRSAAAVGLLPSGGRCSPFPAALPAGSRHFLPRDLSALQTPRAERSNPATGCRGYSRPEAGEGANGSPAGLSERAAPAGEPHTFLHPFLSTPATLTAPLAKPWAQALLEGMLWVTDAQRRQVPARIAVSEHEMCWQFTPERPWKMGAYEVVSDTRLEASAGNSIARPFELDVF